MSLHDDVDESGVLLVRVRLQPCGILRAVSCKQVVDCSSLIHVGQSVDDSDVAILPSVLAVNCSPMTDVKLELVGAECLCERLGVLVDTQEH